jgi:IS5 family transposase
LQNLTLDARPGDIAKMPDRRVKTRVKKQERRKAVIRAKMAHPFRVISASLDW